VSNSRHDIRRSSRARRSLDGRVRPSDTPTGRGYRQADELSDGFVLHAGPDVQREHVPVERVEVGEGTRNGRHAW
jgi:hypothetical protein